MNAAPIPENDAYLNRLKASRNSSAVLKVRLAEIRSLDCDVNIFAFEGVDDKTVYFHWVKSTHPTLKYEPFICKTKSQVFQLMDMLERDINDLGRGVYYFVDSDFDGLRGRDANDLLYLTDTYSIENTLVSEDILNTFLSIEFHCNGTPHIRTKISSLFKTAYRDFLNATRDINFRIYCARRCQIRQLDDLPSRINKIASIELMRIEVSDIPLNELVALEREPSDAEITNLRADFEKLIASQHYRGKFSLLFFLRWLALLLQERKKIDSDVFAGASHDPEMVPHGNFTIDALASRSTSPPSLTQFLKRHFDTVNTLGIALNGQEAKPLAVA